MSGNLPKDASVCQASWDHDKEWCIWNNSKQNCLLLWLSWVQTCTDVTENRTWTISKIRCVTPYFNVCDFKTVIADKD